MDYPRDSKGFQGMMTEQVVIADPGSQFHACIKHPDRLPLVYHAIPRSAVERQRNLAWTHEFRVQGRKLLDPIFVGHLHLRY